MTFENSSAEGLNEAENSSELPKHTPTSKIDNSLPQNEVLEHKDGVNLDNTNLQKNKLISEISPQNYYVLLEECRQLSGNEISEENIYEFTLNFAKNCNYLGLPQNVSEGYALLKFNLLEDEISSCFEQVYIENAEYFAKFADIASLQEWKMIKGDDNDTLPSNVISPPLPDWIFEKLPDLLKNTCAIFESKRERDVFFTSALGVLSGCLPNTSGVYFGSTVYPNLYGFIIAPPASGKGVLKYSKALAAKYHNNVVDDSKKQKRDYDNQLELFNRNRRGNNIMIKPQEPPFKVVFIPANTSLSMLVKHLKDNDGAGIICETEADTMGNANKQDWGSYSPLLRAAFHHENYSLSRKTNQEYLEILEPKLSVILTGTPSQLSNLMNSIQDGLFSRFIFYSYKSDPTWNDPFNSLSINFDKYFKQIAEDVNQSVEYLRSYPTIINLTSAQSDVFNSKFRALLQETTFCYGDEIVSIIRRLGLVTFRICMILTALNKVQNGDLTEQLVCTDEDFSIALAISEVCLNHSIHIYKTIPKKEPNEDRRSKLRRNIFNELPNEFDRKDAIALAKKFNISVRSIDSMLQQEEGKLIEKISNGKFRKL